MLYNILQGLINMQALASFLAFLTAGGTSLLCVALTSLAVVGYALVGALLVAGEPCLSGAAYRVSLT